MPLTIKLNKKEVARNNDTDKLIKLLTNVLAHNHINENILSEVAKHDQKGFWGVLLKLAETATGGLHNYEIITFSPMTVDLDASAFVLFKFYQNYLNTVAKQMDCSAKDTQSLSISNHYVLLREILLRFAAITLKVKVDDADYGNKIIKVLSEFVGAINASEILVKKGWFSNELTMFGIDLVTTHDEWISIFEKMVALIKDIHLPQTSISEMLTYLLEIKNTIARHILIRSDYAVKQGELSDDWIMSTFLCFEKNYSVTMKAIALQNNELMFPNTSFDAIKKTSIQVEICRSIQAKTGKNISNLFDLLNKTNFLFKIGMQIENLINVGGWMPIISGLINLDNLWKLFGAHIKSCDALLSFTREGLEKNKANVVYQEWVKYRKPQIMLRGLSLQHNLTLLKSPAVRQQIFNLISDSICQLQAADNNMSYLMNTGEDCPLVNKNILINFTGSFGLQDYAYEESNGRVTKKANREFDAVPMKKIGAQTIHSLSINKLRDLYDEYKSSDALRYVGNFFSSVSSDETIFFIKQAASDDLDNNQRAIIVLDYIQDDKNKALGFCIFLKEKMKQNLIFDVVSSAKTSSNNIDEVPHDDGLIDSQDLLKQLNDISKSEDFSQNERDFLQNYSSSLRN